MHRQSSNLPVYLALTLAVVAAITSMPSGRDVQAKVLWALTTEAAPDAATDGGAGTYIDEAQMLGLP